MEELALEGIGQKKSPKGEEISRLPKLLESQFAGGSKNSINRPAKQTLASGIFKVFD